MFATKHHRPCVCDSSSCPRDPSPAKTIDVDERLSPPKHREQALYLGCRTPVSGVPKRSCQPAWSLKSTSWKINSWNPIPTEVRKMIFLFNWVIFRFQGNSQGRLSWKFVTHLPHTCMKCMFHEGFLGSVQTLALWRSVLWWNALII